MTLNFHFITDLIARLS